MVKTTCIASYNSKRHAASMSLSYPGMSLVAELFL
jgi:hypothetical protein